MRRRAGRIALSLLGAGVAYLFYTYLTLPDVRVLRTSNPKTTAFMELRADEARRKGRPPKRDWRWVRYDRISPNLKRAVLVAEDSAFWQHEGVDVEQLKESMEANLEKGTFARGGSTITQQLAKNLYLSPSKNPVRKLREFFIARRLEAELSKRRILELYLNVIEWGDGIYGAEAAARAYFHQPSATLGPSESALLAGAIINPRVYSPAHPNARLLRRQRLILGRMGAVTPPPAEPVPAERVPSATVPPPSPSDLPPAEVEKAPDQVPPTPPAETGTPAPRPPADPPAPPF